MAMLLAGSICYSMDDVEDDSSVGLAGVYMLASLMLTPNPDTAATWHASCPQDLRYPTND